MLEDAWTSGEDASGNPTGYGLGFRVEEEEGFRKIYHSGSWNGTSTYVSLFPQAGLAVIILSNREDEDCSEMGERLEQLLYDSIE